MAKDFDAMENSNRSANPSVHAVSDPARRIWLRGGPGSALAAAFAPLTRSLSSCASGMTPWGTCLSGEENRAGYFNGPAQPDADQRRWGLRQDRWYRWSGHDKRFDATQHPHEFHRFGWVVGIDPMDPSSTPVKRTALGRAAHEGARLATTRDGRAVVYSGEDARFEYLYKFVSRDRITPAGIGLSAAQANRRLLDHGTLYVARFDADGTGRWLPLVHGQGPLTAANGFADQGALVIKTRQASDLLGATKMDRPEWLAIDPKTREAFCTLTNHSGRGQPGPRRRATSTATPSAAPMAWSSTRAACCGSRPTSARLRSARARWRAWATTRCWPVTPAAASCGASSPARWAAK